MSRAATEAATKAETSAGTKTAAEVRAAFLDFFAGKDHHIVNSAPVVPDDDPTLLFTNAGMNQFKDVFLGTGSRPYTRCADTQKCIRVSGKHNDLEEVGQDTYHHTFFEMLGNWSFGDYFKAEAIAWAWELLTGEMGLAAERLWATVFGGDEAIGLGADEEAESLWPQVTGIPAERVLRCSLKDNFWEMGETGPCGPCSEIHLDQGAAACDRQHVEGHVCKVNGDCRRYIEIWNLVFIQFNNTGGYKLQQLPARHVDTGMGFERLVAAVQGKISNYDTDVFQPIFSELTGITGRRYGDDQRTDVAFRVIADHVRALCAAIADGAMPDAKMRGSTLRSLLRRAARFGRQTLEMDEPFLYRLVPVTADLLQPAFPEIGERRDHIALVLEAEESSFGRTINRGLRRFATVAEQTRSQGGTVIDGHEAFRLFHQDGFPRDLIDQMAREQALTVDEQGWQQAKKEHEEVSRQGGVPGYRFDHGQIEGLPATEFVGYWERCKGEGKGTVCAAELLKLLNGEHLVLDRTPFYAASGGQVGDHGEITGEGFCFRVDDTMRVGDVIVHCGELVAGDAEHTPQQVSARVTEASRLPTAANHTATHLLHWALKQVLGPGANQQGSYVGVDRLRFDFNQPQPMTAEQLIEVERLVNDRIQEAVPLAIGEDSFENAKARGVTALFGEKYGDRVRVIEIGGFSQELCGGTHVTNTGEIGLFKIISEEGVAAGVRRIEAVTAAAAVRHVQHTEQVLRQAAAMLNAAPEVVPERIAAIKAREQELQRQIDRLKQQLRSGGGGSDGDEREVAGVKVFAYRAPFADARSLRELVDHHRNRLGSGIVLVGGAEEDKVTLVVGITDDLVGRFKAGNLVRELASHVDGKGGGRADFAQAGGRNPAGLERALAELFPLVEATASR